jgi:hypothetical protein
LGGAAISGGWGLSIGAAAGIGVGVAAFTVALIVVVAFFIHRHRVAQEKGKNFPRGSTYHLDDAQAPNNNAQAEEPMVKMIMSDDNRELRSQK